MSEFTIDTYAADGRTLVERKYLDPIDAWFGRQCPFYIQQRSGLVFDACLRAEPKYAAAIEGKEYNPSEKAGHWNRIFSAEMEIAARHLY